MRVPGDRPGTLTLIKDGRFRQRMRDSCGYARAMWIVKVALQRPYTFLMLAALIVLLGVFSIPNTPTDIFPAIRIPIVAVT
jgi:hypothetical protein